MKRLQDRQRSENQSRARKSENRRGALVVEFAVIAPVIFLFIFAFFEFGRMLMVQHALSDAARFSCRQASLASMTSSNDVITKARERLTTVIPNVNSVANITVSPSFASVADIPTNSPITVTISVNHNQVSWLPVAVLLNQNGVLTAEANMERE